MTNDTKQQQKHTQEPTDASTKPQTPKRRKKRNTAKADSAPESGKPASRPKRKRSSSRQSNKPKPEQGKPASSEKTSEAGDQSTDKAAGKANNNKKPRRSRKKPDTGSSQSPAGIKPQGSKRGGKKPAASSKGSTQNRTSSRGRSGGGSRSRPSGKSDDIVLPSREAILNLLDDRGELMKLEHLAVAFELEQNNEREALSRRLAAMLRDGQLLQNRRGGFGLSDKLDLVPGRIIGHPDGFGFVAPDRGEDDLFVSAREMRQVLHGDRVLVSVKGVDRRGRKEAAIVSVLERANTHMVGRFYNESGARFVIADEKKVSQNILVKQTRGLKVNNGDFVYLEIVEQPNKRQPPLGRIIEVLGDRVNAAMAVTMAVRSHDLPDEWPADVKRIEPDLPHQVSDEDRKGRNDIRKLPLVTIDGADAKDFDDAVYCQPLTMGGYKLLVAIADVSHYVTTGNALDLEAIKRGTSAYFPGRVIPMLPEALSNGICSLMPQVDRLCMVCEITFDRKGGIKRSKFYDAVMHSHARLTYDQAWGHLSGELPLDVEKKVNGSLQALYSLYQLLDKRRKKRGAIEFNSTEVAFEFDGRDEVKRIIQTERNEAHKLIEECMIAANVEAAKFLTKKKIPAPFRVHATPPEQKLDALRQALAELNIKLPADDRVSPEVFARILKECQERPEYDMIQSLVLRSMSMAVYQAVNGGHFGLSLEAYTHFTSPIRRYPDLLVHRAIRSTFKGSDQSRYSIAEMEKLTSHCSMTERRAEDASREVDDRLKCAYLKAHVGESFEGKVTGVKHFGLFVELDGLRISGLVHVTALPNDYYHYDPVTHILSGEKRGKQYKLGDSVRVEVARVDVDDREIDFVIESSK